MIEINLLEEKKSAIGLSAIKENKYTKEINFKFLILAILFFYVQGWALKKYLSDRLTKVNTENEKLREEMTILKKREKKNKEVKKDIDELNKKIAIINKFEKEIQSLVTSKVNLFPPLKKMAEVIPQDVWLMEISMNNNELTLKGHAEKHAAISSFSSNLNNEIFFENSFRIGEIKTVEKKEKNHTIRSESFILNGKIFKQNM